ncbi:SH2 domain-containing protein 7 [Osmerus eperlanus]|uniref:SH2 domain-containing protein 7 n=1 Tax=Osmerus eperlanus TaxID=29151 RepID=UPI002E1046A3
MTLGSDFTQQSSTTVGTTWMCSCCIRKLVPWFQLSNHCSEKRSVDQRPSKDFRFRICSMFQLKNQDKMDPFVDSQAEGIDWTLREPTLKWFRETQAPLILRKNNFPVWFQGFIPRKDAEETLRDRELGCFLIRLSDKAIGYILSYKGRDRCRHFVINQSKSGQLNISGDTEMHNTLTDLIEYYKRSPIEPFGEFLTQSCLEASTGELYDTIQVNHRDKPVVSVKAVRNIWDQKSDRPVKHLPALPPKNNRSPEAVPPIPIRAGPLKTGFLDEQSCGQAKVLYALLEQQTTRERPMAQSSRMYNLRDPAWQTEGSQPRHQAQQRKNITTEHPAPILGTVYSEIHPLDYRTMSLPLLDNNSENKNHIYRLSGPSFTPPRLPPQLPKQVTRNTILEQSPSSKRPSISHSLNQLVYSPVYHLAGRPSCQPVPLEGDPMTSAEEESMYVEVPSEPIPSRYLLDNTYEQIPEMGLKVEATRHDPNTYETLKKLKPKPNLSTLGLKNEKRRWFFPEIKRK